MWPTICAHMLRLTRSSNIFITQQKNIFHIRNAVPNTVNCTAYRHSPVHKKGINRSLSGGTEIAAPLHHPLYTWCKSTDFVPRK